MHSTTRHAEGPHTDYEAIPEQFKSRDKWLLWDASADKPRRPHWYGNFGVSWKDPDDWHSFEEAVKAAGERDSWGIGYVFTPNDPECMIDIDGPYDENGNPREWFPGLGRFEDAGAYMEWSPSAGIHAPFEGQPPDWWKDCEVDPDLHQGVDVLTNKFCTFTGDKLESAGNEVTDINPAPFLFRAYQNIRGESPQIKSEESDYDGDEWLTDELVEEALREIDPDLPHNEWIRLGYAAHDYDSGSTGKSLFEQWSKQGTKYDDAAKRSIDAIWENASAGSGVTVATLIHKAKQKEWDPPSRETTPESTALESDQYTLTPTGVVRAALDDPHGRLSEPEEGEQPPTVHELRNSEAATYIWSVMEETGRDDVIAVISDDEEERQATSVLRAYNSGIWTRNGEQRLREHGRQAMGSAYSTRVLKQLKEETRAREDCKVPRSELGAPDGTIAVENGLLHLLERDGPQLEELKREHRAIRQLNVEYDSNATPERWIRFVKESIRDETDRKKFQEYCGYTLWHHAQPFGKALFLVGPTDSGKGTALKVIQGILGKQNVGNETLKNLINSRWGGAGIYGKAVNIRNEVTGGGLSNAERFKELTGGGDRITAEFKGQDKFRFDVTQKFLFATNEVPAVEKADEAFYNRCLFVRFPETVPGTEQDKQLEEKLLEEKSGILNWMLEGLRRLMEQGHFTGELDIGGKKEICDAFGGVIDRFTHSCLEITGESELMVHKGDLHDLAQAYADHIDKDPEWTKQSGFTSSLKEKSGINDGQTKRLTGTNEKVFTGVRPLQEALDELNVEVRWTDTSGRSTQGRLNT